jgi:hypothetical protein
MKDPIREPVRRDVENPTMNETEVFEPGRRNNEPMRSNVEPGRVPERRPVRLMDRQPAPRGALGMVGGLVHWAPTWAGMFVSFALLLLLLPVGAAIGLSSGTGAVVWSVICLFAAFFVGGYAVGRTLGYIDTPLARLHGLLCWALTASFAFLLTALLGTALLAPLAAIFGLPTAGAVNAAALGWSAFVALLIGAAACVLGAAAGNKSAAKSYQE